MQVAMLDGCWILDYSFESILNSELGTRNDLSAEFGTRNAELKKPQLEEKGDGGWHSELPVPSSALKKLS
jgi:hypothetical protein